MSIDQATRDEIKEIAVSLEDDLAAARIPGNRPEADTHEDRLRAIEAALTVLLHTLSEKPKP